MKNRFWKSAVNPFERIAGVKALLWGLAAMVVSTVISYFSGWHYHGMLHFGPAPNNEWWCYAVEHLTVWLVPAVVFYIGGRILSPSRIRLSDVFGTTAFAQIPLLLMGVVSFLPPMQALNGLPEQNALQAVTQPWFMMAMFLSVFVVVAIAINIVWMYNALKVSCNLSGYKLRVFFIVAYIGCDVACRYIIAACY